jgi:hypothetical protein
VAVYDGFMQTVFESIFTLMRLAPDGKIYINTYTRHYHLINNPDVQGIGCDVKQHHISLPQDPLLIPLYPNYRLGPIDGSPCDTLGIDVAAGEEMPSQQKTTYSVSPNPAGEMLTLHTQTTLPANASWELYYSLGNRAMIQPLAQGVHSQSIPLDRLPTGAYFYLIKVDGRTLQSGKLIIQR